MLRPRNEETEVTAKEKNKADLGKDAVRSVTRSQVEINQRADR